MEFLVQMTQIVKMTNGTENKYRAVRPHSALPVSTSAHCECTQEEKKNSLKNFHQEASELRHAT